MKGPRLHWAEVNSVEPPSQAYWRGKLLVQEPGGLCVTRVNTCVHTAAPDQTHLRVQQAHVLAPEDLRHKGAARLEHVGCDGEGCQQKLSLAISGASKLGSLNTVSFMRAHECSATPDKWKQGQACGLFIVCLPEGRHV